MSSIPLISHHLFVAAVKDEGWVAGGSWDDPPSPAAEVGAREVPLEVVNFAGPPVGRVLRSVEDPRRVGPS